MKKPWIVPVVFLFAGLATAEGGQSAPSSVPPPPAAIAAAPVFRAPDAPETPSGTAVMPLLAGLEAPRPLPIDRIFDRRAAELVLRSA